jgi:two-component system, cell cycle response regulator
MRFHKAESAFFVFIAVILGAGVILLHAYLTLQTNSTIPRSEEGRELLAFLSQLLTVSGVLLSTGVIFGVFLIYPLIRRQVHEEGKLRAMTNALSQRS